MSDISALFRDADPLARAQRATEMLRNGSTFEDLALDHVGWFERQSVVTRIVEWLACPWKSFPSVVVARQLGRKTRITRIQIAPGQCIELFSFLENDARESHAWENHARNHTPPLNAHLAYRACDLGTLERFAAKHGSPMHSALDGSRLTYLTPSCEIIWNAEIRSPAHDELPGEHVDSRAKAQSRLGTTL